MKIAILTPCYGDTKAEFTTSLARMIITTLQAETRVNGKADKLEVETFIIQSADVAQAREILAQQALSWGADYVLWADADHCFPRDTLLRLLGHGLAVVGANYPRRVQPFAPTAVGLDGRLLNTTKSRAEKGEIERVASLGLGLVLMRTEIFHSVKAPWFLFGVAADGSRVSEDHHFFRKLGEQGIPVHLDHALSWQTGHVGQRILTNQEAVDVNTLQSAPGH